MKTVRLLRRFVNTLIAVSPRNAALGVLLTVSLALIEGVGLLLLVPLLQLVGVEAQQGALSRVVAGFSSAFAALGLQPTLGIVLSFFVAVVALQSVLQRWQAMLSARVQYEMVTTLRVRLYRAIAGTTWVFFARSRLSDFTHVLSSELERVGSASHYLVDLFASTLVLLVYLTLAFRVSPETTVLVLLCGSVLAWVLRGRLTDSHKFGQQGLASRAELHAAIADHLGSMKTARSYGVAARHADIFARLSENLQSVDLRAIAETARLRQQGMLGSAIVLASIVYVSRAILALPTADLLLLLFLFARLVPRLTGLFERAQSFASVLPAFAAVDTLEARCLAAAEPAVARHDAIDLQRGIRFDRVTFSYADGSDPALDRLSLDIDARTITAVVGSSGAGKSTMADLLLGLVTPQEGAIVIDGETLTPARIRSWRDQVGYVTQDTFLFHDSVRANLLWAKPAASDDELWQALTLAAAADFVARLPAGIESVVGDRGVLISGGERQRLSLARALLRQPRLLILDEATSSLDSENETRIQQAIDRLRQRMTIVVITHRLSAIRTADVIHVLAAGRLVESGTWAELSAEPGGRFAQLYRAQGVGEPLAGATDLVVR